MKQHPTAIVHPATRISEDVTIGAYALVEDGVELGKGCTIGSHAILRSGTILGDACTVDSHCVLGGLPQDLSFDPAIPTGVRIGNNVTFREGVTINRATVEGQFTEIGDDAFFMANSHAGHDCRVGHHVIVANAVLLAGKVTVGDHVFIGGAAGVHQFCRIGESAMISGLSRVSQDAPPFCIYAERNELIGLNLIGLKRRGFPREAIKELKALYQEILLEGGRPRAQAGEALKNERAQTEQGRFFLEFMAEATSRGVARPRGGGD